MLNIKNIHDKALGLETALCDHYILNDVGEK